METEALSLTTSIKSPRDWSLVYSELTRHLKNKIENNKMDEVDEIFKMREQLLLKLNNILRNCEEMEIDQEVYMALELIKSMESECARQLKMKINSSRSQLSNLNKFKQSRKNSKISAKDKVVSRFIDLKR